MKNIHGIGLETLLRQLLKVAIGLKNNVSPVIAKIVSPLGIAIDDLGQHGAGEFFSETMESIGRMIPIILTTAFGGSTALASTASQIYFFSSSFGNGFSEAIARGATIGRSLYLWLWNGDY